MLTDFFFKFFLLFLPFFDFDFGNIVCFILSSSCGYYAASSVSVSAATRLAYVICILIRTLMSPFCLTYTICFQLLCVVSSVFFCLFSSWGNLPLQGYWSLSCDHGLHCSYELHVRNNNTNNNNLGGASACRRPDL